MKREMQKLKRDLEAWKGRPHKAARWSDGLFCHLCGLQGPTTTIMFASKTDSQIWHGVFCEDREACRLRAAVKT